MIGGFAAIWNAYDDAAQGMFNNVEMPYNTKRYPTKDDTPSHIGFEVRQLKLK